MYSKQQQGFTLLELLVALAIFAVIAVMAYSGLNTVLRARLQPITQTITRSNTSIQQAH